MSKTRIDMLESLKRITVPVIRTLGFKGSGQNFHRIRDGHVDLLTFQFSVFPGRLIAEISYVTAEKKNIAPAQALVPVAKLRVPMAGRRLRLGRGIKNTDPWFVYCNPMGSDEILESTDSIATTFSNLIETEGEQWWRMQPH